DVKTAPNGREAWELLQLARIPIVISDWYMPEMDGNELCRRIRARTREPYVYFILVTSRGGKQQYLAGMDAGADDLLATAFKPGLSARAARRAPRAPCAPATPAKTASADTRSPTRECRAAPPSRPCTRKRTAPGYRGGPARAAPPAPAHSRAASPRRSGAGEWGRDAAAPAVLPPRRPAPRAPRSRDARALAW